MRAHNHDHDSGQHPGGGLRHRLEHLLRPHSHDSTDKIDSAVESSKIGMRALWISLLVLAATAGLQAIIAGWSGSVALLGDTLHNLADALTAVPLGIAFLIGRRAANRRYTYGYGRAEDLAGIAIVLTIAAFTRFFAIVGVSPNGEVVSGCAVMALGGGALGGAGAAALASHHPFIPQYVG